MPEAGCLINETNYLFPSCAKVGGSAGGRVGGRRRPIFLGFGPVFEGRRGRGARGQRRIRLGRALQRERSWVCTGAPESAPGTYGGLHPGAR